MSVFSIIPKNYSYDDAKERVCEDFLWGLDIGAQMRHYRFGGAYGPEYREVKREYDLNYEFLNSLPSYEEMYPELVDLKYLSDTVYKNYESLHKMAESEKARLNFWNSDSEYKTEEDYPPHLNALYDEEQKLYELYYDLNEEYRMHFNEVSEELKDRIDADWEEYKSKGDDQRS